MPYFFAYLISWVIAASGALTVLVSVIMFKFVGTAAAPPALGAAGSLSEYLMPIGVFVAGFLLMGIGQLIQSVIDTARYTGQLVAEMQAARPATAAEKPSSADIQGY